ncbi:MAG: hypothetical protein K2L51_04885, partial [Clostridiales bacterium]|nr:hypothetical protein [Clostridiales bacterium]
GAAIVWENYTGETLQISVSGAVNVIVPAAIRVWTLNADGTGKEKVQDIFADAAGVRSLTNAAYVLAPGEKLAVIFGDVAGSVPKCAPSIRIAATAAFAVDRTAFDRALAAAKTIASGNNADGAYTADSFAQLQTAITNGDAFAAAIADKTYAEISGATNALRQAVRDLRLNTAAAKAELQNEIVRAQSFTGKTLLIGEQSALTAAIATAQAVYDNENATSEQVTNATAALKTHVDGIVVQVADFASDFAQTQGNNGWLYATAEIADWDTFANTWLNKLAYDSDRYGDAERYIRKTDGAVELRGGSIAVGYYNYTQQAHEYTFVLHGAYVADLTESAALTVGVIRRNGAMTFYLNNGWHSYTNDTIDITWTVRLEAGETFAVILRNSGEQLAATTLALGVGCNDTLQATESSVVQANADWSVYNAGIRFNDGNPSELENMTAVPYNGETHIYEGDGTTVQSGANGCITVTATSSVALVFTAPASGTYTFTIAGAVGGRGNGRFYTKATNGTFVEEEFFGRNVTVKQIELEANKQIAVHFEGGMDSFLLMLTVTKA